MPRFDNIFKLITKTIEEDYAGYEEKKELHHPRFFINPVGQAYKDRRLDDLLFFRYMNQYLKCLQDYNIKFVMKDHDDYFNGSLGFKTRRFRDSLYVTSVSEENRVRLGDCITLINNYSPAWHFEHVTHNFFGSDNEDAQNFDGFLKMASKITVRHASGEEEIVGLKKYPVQTKEPKNALEVVQGYALIHVEDFNEEVLALLNEAKQQDKLVVDLRRATTGDLDSVVEAMSYLINEEHKVSELLSEENYYTNYTTDNCKYKIAELNGYLNEDNQEIINELISELESKSGQGYLLDENEYADDDRMIEANCNFKEVIILSDCYTSDENEIFIRLAKKFGNVKVVGRATSGKYNYTNNVTIKIDDLYYFSYPMSKRAEIVEGAKPQGIEPDIYVEFTPEECVKDIILKNAINM